MNKPNNPVKKILAAAALAVILAASGGYAVVIGGADNVKTYAEENRLFIPPLIDSRQAGRRIKLVMRAASREFFPGVKSDTKGFNQSYLGPSIRLYKGDTTRIIFNNNLKEPTTVHGHGLHVNGEVDGGPQGSIPPGGAKTVDLSIVQEAGTSWYHPHFMGTTAEHVYAGLAGLYLIEDDNSQTLPLPKKYGINDIPLIVQDRSFINGKMRHYAADNDDIMDGIRGETLLVNGTINPHLSVPAGWVRLRLLNGSNARFYRFYFAGDIPFFKIATEGGFLNKPVEITSITMAPGERNEIMIDMTKRKTLDFLAAFLPADPGGIALADAGSIDEMMESFIAFVSPPAPVVRVLALRADDSIRASGALPEVLNNIDYFTEADRQVAVRRDFTLDMDAADDRGPIGADNMLSINGQPMRMDTINMRVNKGDLELWTITAEMMPHPFHVHGVSFQILLLNGQPPGEEDKGWKDTVVVTEQPTKILMRFNHTASDPYPYMFHCHILEHEDAGMMGQFTVI